MSRKHRCNLGGRLLQIGEVGSAIVALRGLHAQVSELAIFCRFCSAHDETKVTAGDARLDDLLQAWLVDRQDAVAEPLDSGWVYVGTHHVVSEVGKARTGRETDVARADDCDS